MPGPGMDSAGTGGAPGTAAPHRAIPGRGRPSPRPPAPPRGSTSAQNKERRRANTVRPRGRAALPPPPPRPRADPAGGGSARRGKAPPAPHRPSGQRRGRYRRAPCRDNKNRSRRCVCRGVSAGDRQKGGEKRKKKEKGGAEKKRTNFSYLSSLIASSSFSWTCISAARSALPTPCCCPARMSCLYLSGTAPRRDVFLPRSFSPFLEAAFIARWVGRAAGEGGAAARRCPAWRRGVAPPPRRGGPGRGDARGRPRRLCRPRAHFSHLCELPGTGRFEADGAGVRGGREWGGGGGLDLLLQSLPQPNGSRRPALTSAPPARAPKLRSPGAAGGARCPADSEGERPRGE